MAVVITGSQNGTVGLINAGTAVASTSGTSIDFTSIPAGVKRITVMFNGVSTNGTSSMLVQIGSGSITSSGYLGSATGYSNVNFSSGFSDGSGNASAVRHGAYVLTNISSNNWVVQGVIGSSNVAANAVIGGSVSLSGTLDRVRITTSNGTDTFDAGSINILYE